ncbi:MAG: gamma carbonic anhydrase family protein [Firmicutes bacterium]|nr:gamma carbonic anhydrase family protein [Bacillota bacterium]
MSDPIYPNHQAAQRIPAWIAPTAVLIGQVVLGENVQVHYNSVIRGDGSRVVIGDHSVVLENCFVKSSAANQVVIGSRVTVGHRAVLEGCIIHDGAVIGEGAQVLEGASVGRGAMIDPGAVVPRNSVVPPCSRFSVLPGQPPRELTAEEMDEMKALWEEIEKP